MTGRVLMAVAVLALVAGCGSEAAGAPEKTAVPGTTAAAVAGGVRCGAAWAVPGGQRLTVTARFPATAREDGQVSGTIAVAGDAEGVGAPAADVFLVRNGKVVAEPVPQDSVGVRWVLPKTVPGTLAPGSCGALVPGTYQLYARVAIDAVEAYGGPWPITLSR